MLDKTNTTFGPLKEGDIFNLAKIIHRFDDAASRGMDYKHVEIYVREGARTGNWLSVSQASLIELKAKLMKLPYPFIVVDTSENPYDGSLHGTSLVYALPLRKRGGIDTQGHFIHFDACAPKTFIRMDAPDIISGHNEKAVANFDFVSFWAHLERSKTRAKFVGEKRLARVAQELLGKGLPPADIDMLPEAIHAARLARLTRRSPKAAKTAG
jgi:hypothetical protein